MCEDCVKCLAVQGLVCERDRVRVWLDTCMLGLYTSYPSASTQHIVVYIIRSVHGAC